MDRHLNTLLTMHGGVKHLRAEYLQGHWALSSLSVPDICISFSHYSFQLLIFFGSNSYLYCVLLSPHQYQFSSHARTKRWLAFRYIYVVLSQRSRSELEKWSFTCRTIFASRDTKNGRPLCMTKLPQWLGHFKAVCTIIKSRAHRVFTHARSNHACTHNKICAETSNVHNLLTQGVNGVLFPAGLHQSCLARVEVHATLSGSSHVTSNLGSLIFFKTCLLAISEPSRHAKMIKFYKALPGLQFVS